MRADYFDWMSRQGFKPNTLNTRRSDARRVEQYYGDLDEAYDRDRFASVLSSLQYSSVDERAGRDNPTPIPIEGNLYKCLASYRSALQAYARFREDVDSSGQPGRYDQRFGLVHRDGTTRYAVMIRRRDSGEESFQIGKTDPILTSDLAEVARAVLLEGKAARFGLVGSPRNNILSYAGHAVTGYTLDPSIAAQLGLAASGARNAGEDFDLGALELLKGRFLVRYPDFAQLGFAASEGRYWDEERAYKQDLIDRAAQVMARGDLTPFEMARSLLDIVTSRDANFLDWRVLGRLSAFRGKDQGLLVEAVADMIMADEAPADAVGNFVEKVAAEYFAGHEGNIPYADLRVLPTTLLALIRPDEAIAVQYQPIHAAGMRLHHRALLKNGPFSADEYRDVLVMAETIAGVMETSWGWEPRDLWDVQGFIWATSATGANAAPADDAGSAPGGETTPPSSPTNLILYGPPGTGKTYATAAEAVRLCDGSAPADRPALMERYHALVARRRIAFVTFHQSYSYEDFVEGLRPEFGEGSTAVGFSLKPRPGIFRTIAELARANRGAKREPEPLDRRRKVFKMSLGRSWNEEGTRLFREAIEGRFVALGYGGEIDWSAPEYDEYEAIKRRWQQDHPGVTGNDPNIAQLYTLRANMEVGSLIVVSDGNKRFRAIGEVTGPYYYQADDVSEYGHRRPVRWLWQSAEGLPRELVYGRGFSQVSAYQLDSEQVDWPSLEQIVAGGGAGEPDGSPEPYVLIIDEINRANISKVLGELISLIEPDKRLGGENALTVTLPYSGDTFGVPANLHIVGTMNTADRSIALLDTALRRRFRFRELMPDPSALADASERAGLDLGRMLVRLNERIEYLFDREHQIGHAYFVNCRSRAHLDDIMRHHILPLLAEYFYEDWEKVAQVLGDADGQDGFLLREPLRGIAEGAGDARFRYRVREDGFADEAYRRLIGE